MTGQTTPLGTRSEEGKYTIAVRTVEEFLREGLHLGEGRLVRWLRMRPGSRDDLLRLAAALRHMPKPGSQHDFTDAEKAGLRWRLLRRFAASHDTSAAATPMPSYRVGASVTYTGILDRDDVLDVFLRHCQDGNDAAVARWCRAFPTFASELVEVASSLVRATIDQSTRSAPDNRFRGAHATADAAERTRGGPVSGSGRSPRCEPLPRSR